MIKVCALVCGCKKLGLKASLLHGGLWMSIYKQQRVRSKGHYNESHGWMEFPANIHGVHRNEFLGMTISAQNAVVVTYTNAIPDICGVRTQTTLVIGLV